VVFALGSRYFFLSILHILSHSEGPGYGSGSRLLLPLLGTDFLDPWPLIPEISSVSSGDASSSFWRFKSLLQSVSNYRFSRIFLRTMVTHSQVSSCRSQLGTSKSAERLADTKCISSHLPRICRLILLL
jgi:hypothetical protein